MTDMWSIKEIIQHVALGIPKGINAISIFIALSINISIRNENVISEEEKTKNQFEMILQCRVSYTSLRSWKGSQKLNIHLFIEFDSDIISSIWLTTQL